MNLTTNQYIDLFSQHMCLAKGEKIALDWAYYGFSHELTKLRHDLLRALESQVENEDYAMILELYNLYINDGYISSQLEAVLDDWINDGPNNELQS